ncbi:MAG: PLP-dependent aminotransferase family protein [Chloroflexota bacterium]|nr:PLP-dependent aminotransferase family protein [Chloroflexota bacterium]
MADRMIVFTRGVPAPESFPIERVAEAASYAVRNYEQQTMQYTTSYGFLPLREQLAAKYEVEPEQVLLSNGSLQIIDFLGHVLLEEGSVIFTESPTYDRTLTLARRHKANIVGVPLEADGPDIDALERALGEHPPAFFYLIPDFQNPSGATASLSKRRHIAELAREYDFWLIEDAPYRPLRYWGEQLPSLFDLVPERTLHLSSYTKQISPGVRVGYLVGDEDLLKQVAKVAEDTYITPNLVGEAIVYEFIRRGWLEEQLESLKALYGPRLEAISQALRTYLPDAEWIEPDGGFFLSVTLPEGITSETLRAAAKEQGLILSDGRGFFPDPDKGERFLRLPFCALTEEELEEGVRRLAETVTMMVGTVA